MEELNLTVTKVVVANRLYNTASEQLIWRRSRSHWGLVLKRTGRTIYTSEGTQIPSDRHHPVLLPKGSCYSWQCVEAGECLIIEFDAPQTGTHAIPFTVSDSTFIEKGFLEIQKHLHEPTAEARLEVTYRLYGLLLQLVKSAAKEYVSKAKQQLLQPAMDYICENYFDPSIGNDRLAALCGISTVYFRKSFEAAYGMPPIRYLHDYRIQRAKDILSSDYSSISQVAESVGYRSVYHFSKMFKHYTGQSPSLYAKRLCTPAKNHS